jgi:hypothetical protein
MPKNKVKRKASGGRTTKASSKATRAATASATTTPLSMVPKQIKEILTRLERIEKKIDECCGTCCVDFTTKNTSSQNPMNLPNPYTEVICDHKFVFSTQNNQGLFLEPAGGTQKGMRIPYDMIIEISPPCNRITIEISSYAEAHVTAYDTSGSAIFNDSVTTNTDSYTFNISGNPVKLEFKTQNEEDIKKICCYES